jgi:hypothetical protein
MKMNLQSSNFNLQKFYFQFPIPNLSRGHVFDFRFFSSSVIPACPESGENLEFMYRVKRKTGIGATLTLSNERFTCPILGVVKMTMLCNIIS